MIRGDRLRVLRESKGFSREYVTSQLGFGANQLYRYESEKNDATGDVIVKLAKFYKVSADYLLGLTDIPNPYHKTANPVRISTNLDRLARLFGPEGAAKFIKTLGIPFVLEDSTETTDIDDDSLDES